jgi:hypothetical protein
MEVILSGRVMDVRAEQPSKAKPLIDVTLFGMFKFLTFILLCFKVVTLSGIITRSASGQLIEIFALYPMFPIPPMNSQVEGISIVPVTELELNTKPSGIIRYSISSAKIDLGITRFSAVYELLLTTQAVCLVSSNSIVKSPSS